MQCVDGGFAPELWRPAGSSTLALRPFQDSLVRQLSSKKAAKLLRERPSCWLRWANASNIIVGSVMVMRCDERKVFVVVDCLVSDVWSRSLVLESIGAAMALRSDYGEMLKQQGA
jgi:hypothetical protein